VATKDSGEWYLTRNGAFRFSAVRKKDMADAALFALVRALIWLKARELEFQVGGEEYTGIYVMWTEESGVWAKAWFGMK